MLRGEVRGAFCLRHGSGLQDVPAEKSNDLFQITECLHPTGHIACYFWKKIATEAWTAICREDVALFLFRMHLNDWQFPLMQQSLLGLQNQFHVSREQIGFFRGRSGAISCHSNRLTSSDLLRLVHNMLPLERIHKPDDPALLEKNKCWSNTEQGAYNFAAPDRVAQLARDEDEYEDEVEVEDEDDFDHENEDDFHFYYQDEDEDEDEVEHEVEDDDDFDDEDEDEFQDEDEAVAVVVIVFFRVHHGYPLTHGYRGEALVGGIGIAPEMKNAQSEQH
eukprot:s162_g34.t1